MRLITEDHIEQFKKHLYEEEKSDATVNKYLHDVLKFRGFTNGKPFDKKLVLKYKASLADSYSKTSVNSMLSAINSFFVALEWPELRVKALKIQRPISVSYTHLTLPTMAVV